METDNLQLTYIILVLGPTTGVLFLRFLLNIEVFAKPRHPFEATKAKGKENPVRPKPQPAMYALGRESTLYNAYTPGLP